MFVEVIVLSAVLSSAPLKRCGEGTHIFSADSCGTHFVVTADSPQEPAILYSQSLAHAVADDLSFIPEVKHVLVDRAEQNLLVWVCVANPTKDVREQVFQKQFDLIEAFPEVSFDFNLVAVNGQSPEEIASGAQLLFSREG